MHEAMFKQTDTVHKQILIYTCIYLYASIFEGEINARQTNNNSKTYMI